MISRPLHEEWMRRALAVASSFPEDVPVGAVVFDAEGTELAAAGRGERVEARPLVVVGLPPLRLDPAFLPHPLQRRIERALLDANHVLRHPLQMLRDRIAVHVLEAERFQDQHVEQPGQQRWLGEFGHVSAIPVRGKNGKGIDRLCLYRMLGARKARLGARGSS